MGNPGVMQRALEWESGDCDSSPGSVPDEQDKELSRSSCRAGLRTGWIGQCFGDLKIL